jgi:hypothetical protein
MRAFFEHYGLYPAHVTQGFKDLIVIADPELRVIAHSIYQVFED